MNDAFISKRPYLIPAYYHWLVACGLKPHVVVQVDYPGVCVPDGYDDDGKIVLNIDPEAVRDFKIDHNWIVFDAVFNIDPVTVRVPIGAVVLMFVPDTQWFVDFLDDPEPQASVVAPGEKKAGKKSIFRIIKKNESLDDEPNT